MFFLSRDFVIPILCLTYFTDIAPKSYADLYEAIQPLGQDELQRLYQELGIPQQDVEKAEASVGTKDTNLKAKAVIRCWKKRNGKIATLEALLHAITICGRIRTTEMPKGNIL